MKQWLVVFCLLGLAIAAAGQQASQMAPGTVGGVPSSNLVVRGKSPTYSDLNCAGFISSQSIPNSNYVAGGWESPDATRFAERDYVYLGGVPLQEGSEYSILRELKDPNKSELFKGQHAVLAGMGNAWAELGRVKVIGHANKVSIGQVMFSCDSMVPGDVAIPYVERPSVPFRRSSRFERFAQPNGLPEGRIAMAKDFDYIVGTGQKVYLTVGADKGIKPGDYFRVVRSSTAVYHDPVDSLSRLADVAEDTQKHAPSYHGTGSGVKIDANEYPRKALAELIILNVTPKSATGMITYALEQAQVGDTVELEEPLPPEPPAVAPRGPQISCTAQPPTVRLGDISTITCNASSPDNRPIVLSFSTDRGRVTNDGPVATLETRSAGAGVITVTGSVSDDRGLTATSDAPVNVEAPTPAATAAASKIADIQFAPNSSRVDNKAKAILDEVALRMQREADAKALIIGMADTSTPAGQRLATARANNVMAYLTRDKGIDAERISTRTANGGDTAEVWLIPAGARAPQASGQ
jgi:outer membrane protein OmpA-like peptidoglycan-associated protein